MIPRILSLISSWLYGGFETGRNGAMRELLAKAEPVRQVETQPCVEVD